MILIHPTLQAKPGALHMMCLKHGLMVSEIKKRAPRIVHSAPIKTNPNSAGSHDFDPTPFGGGHAA